MISFKNSCDGCYSAYSLDLRALKACDNKCSFCIERCGIDSLGETDVKKLIQSTLTSGKGTVLILGGEPLLIIPKILEYTKGIRDSVGEIYLTTSLPWAVEENWDDFSELMGLLDGLNVSLQHYDKDINNDVLHASSRHDRIKMLGKICDSWADKVRVSINLVKGYIDSKEEIDNFLSAMEAIGVKHVKINELQGCEDTYVSFEKAYGMKLKSPYAHGCQFDIDIHDGMRVTLKRACFTINQNLDASFADFVKVIAKKFMKKQAAPQMVLYENGDLSVGWRQKK